MRGRVLRACAVGAVVVVSVLAPRPSEAGARKYVEKGNKFYFKGDFDKALNEYLVADKEITAQDREYPIAMLNIAAAYRRVGDFQNSVAYLDKASEKIWGPKGGWQSLNLGFGTGLLTNESKQDWIGTENERFFVRFYSALSNLELGKFDDAVIDLKMCEKLSENYPLQRYLHGWANAMLSDEKENAAVHFKAVGAASAGKQFAAVGGGTPFATVQLARLTYLNGDGDAAGQMFKTAESALAQNPILASRDEVLKSGTNLILIVEKGWTQNVAKDFTSKYHSVRISVDGSAAGNAQFAEFSGQHDKIGGGEAVKGAMAAVATEMAKRELVKRIPGAGLFMGHDRAPSVKSWDKIAPAFYLYETRVAPGQHKVTAELLNEAGSVVATAEGSVGVGGNPKFVSLYLFRTQK